MKAISSMATRHVLAELLDAAQTVGLPAVEVESVGGVDAAKRVTAGEQVDLVFLAQDALTRLASGGHVAAGSVVPLLLSQVAVGAPSGTSELAANPGCPAFADAAALRVALRQSARIGYSTGPSGTAFVKLIEEWGLTPVLGDRLVQARPGVPVAKLLADGEVDLGLQQLSELTGQPGVRILGVLPQDCAIDTVFAGAVATTSANATDAYAVLAFLASDAATVIKAARDFGTP